LRHDHETEGHDTLTYRFKELIDLRNRWPLDGQLAWTIKNEAAASSGE
jgi:hypothetical protein